MTPKDLPRLRAHQPHRGVAAPARHGVRRGEPLSARRLRALRLSDRRLRRDVDEDRHRHRAARLRARDPRGSEAREAALPRHRARHLRLVRRRRELAVAAAEPARHAGARHQGGGARPRDRDARPRLLRHGRHRAAAAVGRCRRRELQLFKPEDALRGLDQTLAIDYVLKQPAQKVTIDFLDAQGKVIRTLHRHDGRRRRSRRRRRRTRTSAARRIRSRRRSPACIA